MNLLIICARDSLIVQLDFFDFCKFKKVKKLGDIIGNI